MIRGLYTSGWSMMADSKKMDVITNNLANASTNGYKKDAVVFQSFPSVLTKRIYDSQSPTNPSGEVGSMQLGNDAGEIFTYFRQGQLVSTGNKFDLSLHNSDSAFFSVQVTGENGKVKEYYTRDGSFTLNANQQLVTKDGSLVLGENGSIVLKGEDFAVESDGSIIQGNKFVDRLKITEFEDTKTLRKFGNNLVDVTPQSQKRKFSGNIEQGLLEQSNVNTIREMVDMITVMRSYEANQKVLQAQDSTLEKAVSEVGAVR